MRDDGVVTVEIAPPSGTVTFLFTDIERSTRLWEDHPDEMRGALERHDELVLSAIAGRGGYVFSSGGDGFCAAFGRAEDAVGAAIEAQVSLGAEVWPAETPLRVRMGVHTGEAHERDGNYFGAALNRVGRLHAAAHGGQVVVSDTTEPLVGGAAGLVDLGAHRLRDLGEPRPVFQVVGDGLGSDFPPLRSLESMPNNLPLLVDELVGRSGVVADVVAALDASRLVTLTGVGGTGKTRLAVEVAAQVLPEFADGVRLVELAPVSEPGAVPFVVADVVGAAQRPQESMLDSLVGSLRHRRLLLVLDNCEHLLDPVAELVEQIVAFCAGVRVLATSREGLAVRGEQMIAVPSLASSESAELFAVRARAVGVEVTATDEGVEEIVDRLDGLPLAIELAAARTRSLTLGEIALRLDERFRLLRGAGRGRMERHQTLWNTVAWSYQLLDEIEQAVFDRLSVLAGGFTLEAACGVCGGGDIDTFAIEEAVVALVERSLLVAEPRPWGMRYRMLETIRQFAEAQLADHGNAELLQRRHASWFAGFAEQAQQGIGSSDALEWSARQQDEFDNLRTALYSSDVETGRRIAAATAVEVGWFRLDYEILDWVMHVLESPDQHDTTWQRTALIGLTLAHAAGRRDDLDKLVSHIDPEAITDPRAQLWWLQHLFFEAVTQDRPLTGIAERTLAIAVNLDDVYERARWIGFASIQSVIDGVLDVAGEAWDIHDDPAVRARFPAANAAASFSKGRYLAATGHYSAALENLEQCLKIGRQLNWPLFINVAQAESAWTLVEAGDLDAAGPRLAEAIQAFVQVGDLNQLWTVLHHLTDYYLKIGNRDQAAELWAQLNGRAALASAALVQHLQADLGPQPPPTDTDDDLVARALGLVAGLTPTRGLAR